METELNIPGDLKKFYDYYVGHCVYHNGIRDDNYSEPGLLWIERIARLEKELEEANRKIEFLKIPVNPEEEYGLLKTMTNVLLSHILGKLDEQKEKNKIMRESFSDLLAASEEYLCLEEKEKARKILKEAE
jgi:hypothetical protein